MTMAKDKKKRTEAELEAEMLERGRRDALTKALGEARKYYLACQKTRVFPQTKLEHALYDVGRTARFENREKAYKKFMTYVEEAKRFNRAFG